MCGRYYVDDLMIGKIEKALSGIDNRLNGKTFSGDIFPTNAAPVISAASDHLKLEENRWGYPGMNKKGVIINARAETVQEKRMFRARIEHGRIVILTTQANASMEKIHDRMPLILEPGQVRDWLLDDRATDSILKQAPVMLDKYTEYEQLTFFDL